MRHPTPRQVIPTTCPTCLKAHPEHPELGAYCSFQCLTAQFREPHSNPAARKEVRL
jgi:hypothetical protein